MAGETELQRALELVDEENYEEALNLLDAAFTLTAVDEERCIILLTKTKCLTYLGKVIDARRCLRAVERLDRSQVFRQYVEFSEIHVLYQEGKLREAIDKSDLFLTTNRDRFATPEFRDFEYDLRLRAACELVTLGDYHTAVSRLQEFLREAIEDDRARIHLFLGIAHKQLNHSQAAIDEFKSALEAGGTKDILSDAHYRLGLLYLQTGAAAWAKQHFEIVESMISDAKNVPRRDLYEVLANASGRLGQKEERQRYLQLMHDTPEKP